MTATLLAFWCVKIVCALDAAESLVVWAPNQTHFASAAEQGRIDYHTGINNRGQGTYYLCHPRALSFSEDGSLLAAAGARNGGPAKIKVWRLADHSQLCEIVTAGEGFAAIALSPDGHLIAVANADGRVEVWRVLDGQTQWSRSLSMLAKSIQFSPDSRRLLLRVGNGDKREFDAGNGRPVTERAQ
jgi:WD40 repeat protein